MRRLEAVVVPTVAPQLHRTTTAYDQPLCINAPVQGELSGEQARLHASRCVPWHTLP